MMFAQKTGEYYSIGIIFSSQALEPVRSLEASNRSNTLVDYNVCKVLPHNPLLTPT